MKVPIRKLALPRFIEPMLCEVASEPFDSDQHLFQVKYNGVRCLVFRDEDGLRLMSRSGRDMTAQFPELQSMRYLPYSTVLDGEIVVEDDILRDDFEEAKRRCSMQSKGKIAEAARLRPAKFVAFDMLYSCGAEILFCPLIDRLKCLIALFESELRIDSLQRPHQMAIGGDPHDFYRVMVVRHRAEGIVAKRLDSPYMPGSRSCAWLKIKPQLDAEDRDRLAAKNQGLGS